jgi:hypothetical protein
MNAAEQKALEVRTAAVNYFVTGAADYKRVMEEAIKESHRILTEAGCRCRCDECIASRKMRVARAEANLAVAERLASKW